MWSLFVTPSFYAMGLSNSIEYLYRPLGSESPMCPPSFAASTQTSYVMEWVNLLIPMPGVVHNFTTLRKIFNRGGDILTSCQLLPFLFSSAGVAALS